MNLVLIQSKGRGKPSMLTRISNRKIDEAILCDFDHPEVTREGALEVIEEFRLNIQPESYDPTI